MGTVDDDIQIVKIGKDKFLTLHLFYDSHEPEEVLNVFEHNKSMSKFKEVEFWRPSWDPGKGSHKLVMKEYGKEFKDICKKRAESKFKKNCDKIKW